MKKKWLFLTLIVVVLLGGGLVIWKVSRPDNSTNQPTPNPPRKLTPAELEKYLLEKRLDLQKYFVFNLGKEVKTGKVKVKGGFVANGRNIVPSLSRSLTKLLGARKEWIVFQGKDVNETSLEWEEDKLDEKINNGKEWYIIFDKTKINKENYNYFDKNGRIGNRVFTTSCVLAVESQEGVLIKKSKSEALEVLKTDPALAGRF